MINAIYLIVSISKYNKDFLHRRQHHWKAAYWTLMDDKCKCSLFFIVDRVCPPISQPLFIFQRNHTFTCIILLVLNANYFEILLPDCQLRQTSSISPVLMEGMDQQSQKEEYYINSNKKFANNLQFKHQSETAKTNTGKYHLRKTYSVGSLKMTIH